MAFVVLFSTMSFTVNMHYCGDTLVETAIFKKAKGCVNEKVYVEFCPMADNNSGAYWLSKEEKVINPYFGEAMLTCGEVKQVIE